MVKSSGVEAEKVKGLAISSLYGGSGIPVDDNLEPLAPCLIWMDRRAEQETEWIKQNLDLDELFRITGNTVDSYYGFTKMLWIKNNWPDVWGKINYFLPPNAYVIYQLTGEIAVDYSSAGNIGGIFDINSRDWSAEMMQELGIPIEYQPEKLISSEEVVGGLAEDAAGKLGLKAGTPVVAGGVDAAVATLSAGAFQEGNHVAMIGTSMCWGMITERTNLSNKLVSMPHVVEGKEKIYSFGGAATAGAVIKWFRNVLGQAEMEAERLTDINAYELLEHKTRNIPAGSDGLLLLPYFMGERSPIWDSSARGTIIGLNLFHQKAHLFKAFMEGVAFALRHNMEILENSEKVSLDDKLVLVGGAAKSGVWPQIIADVTGYPVKIIKSAVEAPLGDALLAGLGTGLFDSPEVLSDWLEYREPFQPDRKNKKIYDQLFIQYKEIYKNLKENMKNIGDITR